MTNNLKFSTEPREFFATLNQRVNSYFKTNNISKNANASMVIKTIFMFSLYFVPYFFMVGSGVTSLLVFFILWILMGFGKAGIGLSIMHDANHGSYSQKQWINNVLGASLNIVGGHAFNWKVQHNVLHHTYTNVHEVDEDISPRGIIRMAPESDWKPIHKYQHYYAWFFYGLLTFVWIVFKDYSRLHRYGKDGMVEKQRSTLTKEWILLMITKISYLGYTLAVPIIFTPFTWWQVFLGFFIMHYIAGFILAVIFQPAHVIEGTEYPVADTEGNLENNWAVHQMKTTTNFAHKNRILSWYVGGLNYQVEHHLFPHVCHIHYRDIAPIVKQTAAEFGVPYKSKDTFMDAMKGHFTIMRELGKKPVLSPARA
ncbi:MAG: acyl-CoA desaturase [Flammeovirgaceae bacterium]|nr:acyl-CoA desaturase [Flammeovirgaceae bacterium]